VGIFGGSFNPIHFGHLLIADHVWELLALDRVVFVPARVPPHKPSAELAAPHHRFAMTALAVREHPGFEVSDAELQREGPSYTVDTLAAMGRAGELHLLIGSETFLDLLTWREPRRIVSLARLVVVPRSGQAFDPESPAAQKVAKELDLLPFVRVAAHGGGEAPAGGRAPLLVAAASLPISGSDLRRRAREGRSLAFRMPASVAAYIREHRLYRDAA
jgi:nicotinate-nucleotide adenylyltransferase